MARVILNMREDTQGESLFVYFFFFLSFFLFLFDLFFGCLSALCEVLANQLLLFFEYKRKKIGLCWFIMDFVD